MFDRLFYETARRFLGEDGSYKLTTKILGYNETIKTTHNRRRRLEANRDFKDYFLERQRTGETTQEDLVRMNTILRLENTESRRRIMRLIGRGDPSVRRRKYRAA